MPEDVHSSAKPMVPLAQRRRAFFTVRWQAAYLLLATVLVYLPILRAGFVMDDDGVLAANPLIVAGDGLRRFWLTTQAVDYWPVTWTSLWLEWRLWGSNPLGYHATNLALHCAEVLLLWRILLRLRLPGAWLAALLFAVHPLTVETVAWIAQRKNLVAMLFFLVSIQCFLKTDFASPMPIRRPVRRSLGEGVPVRANGAWYFLSLLAFILAMLGKGSVAPLPLVLLGLIAWHRRPSLRDWARLTPFFAVSAALVVVDVWFQRHGSSEVIRAAGVTERLLGAAAAVWFYLAKSLCPANLIFVYPQWRIVPTHFVWWLPFLMAVGLTAILWRARRRWSRGSLYAWGYFCVMLIPVLGFTDVYFMKFSLVANHYAHLSLIGVVSWVAAMATLAWERAAAMEKARWGVPAAAAAILALGTTTWRQNQTYRDAQTLYEATLSINPASWLIHYNLAVELAKIPHRLPDAIAHYEQVIRINPDSANAHNNLALELLKIPGRLPDAIAQFEQALRLMPDAAQMHNNLGYALNSEGRTPEAIAQYEAALRLQPDDAEVHNNLGYALNSEGQTEKAIVQYEAALRLKLDLPEVHARLGNLLAKVGRLPEAIAEDEAAVRLQPTQAKGHLNLGLALAAAGQSAPAMAEDETALRLDPNLAEAAFYLGVELEQAHRNADAIASYERAVAIRPDYGVAHNNLGVALCNAGKVGAAVPHYQEAIRLNPAYFEAQYNLGFALSSLGRTAEAIGVFQRAVDLAPTNAAARNTLGNALYTNGQIDRALEQFAAASRLNPRDADAHNNLGICRASKGQVDQALIEFETAVKLRPGFAAAELNWSRCLQALGQSEAAEVHRQTAARLQAAGSR